mmetsp:Transcript_11342/g.23926  ORF Transcript_11342/g.23926 Transcript_11342/m.23926 type:complete len:218 (-) Transcript_11342:174-827(-)
MFHRLQRNIHSTAQLLAVLASARNSAFAGVPNPSTACFSSAAFIPSTILSSEFPRPFAIHSPFAVSKCKFDASLIPSRKKLPQKVNMSFFGDMPSESGVQRIDKSILKEIMIKVDTSGREESGYVIIDVRGHDEVQDTGKLHEVVHNLPLPHIADGAMTMAEEDFAAQFGFEKPRLDEKVVFHCKGGVRSAKAVQFAKMAGYNDLLDYNGGANDWFN